MSCPVCDDYGVVPQTAGEMCGCQRGIAVVNGDPRIGKHSTEYLAGLWFDGGDPDDISSSVGLTLTQLSLAIRYEGHRGRLRRG